MLFNVSITRWAATLGHSRIGLISGSQNTEPGRNREHRFLESTRILDLSVTHVYKGDFQFSSGCVAADAFLQTPERERPNAILAANDLMDLGFIQRLQETEMAVPCDVSVVGYDDIGIANWMHPRLTTVRQDPLEVAREGTRRLSERVDAGASATQENDVFVLKPYLIERSSCDELKP